MIGKIFSAVVAAVLFASCAPKCPEMTLDEIEEYKKDSGKRLIENTIYKPWRGEEFESGKSGGIWHGTISADPKTFNQLVAESDGSSHGILSSLNDSLITYDNVNHQWKPQLADFELEIDEEKDSLVLHYTLRKDLLWYLPKEKTTVPVTSDDVVFWYNEIEGDESFHSSGYTGQFIEMDDGSVERVKCVKVNEKSFDFIFPRIIAEPLLFTNMELCPSFIYGKAKRDGGVEAVKNLFNASCDPSEIPTVGPFYIEEYVPSQRIVYRKNPFYWKQDSAGKPVPYVEKEVYQILDDPNTKLLLFKQGKLELFNPSPEQLDAVVNARGNDYSVYRADGSISVSFWSFNQNPKNKDKDFYRWFTKTEFRQAMSCILNRERIISQTYRGLADAKYDFFPPINPCYNKDISLKYRYDREKALELLDKAGFARDKNGILRDNQGVAVEFDLTIQSTGTVISDISQIISDECSSIGIKVNVRQTDFQKIVEDLTSTYDWQSIIIGLGGNVWPTQGPNVWPSYGKLHLWYPEQTKPATAWEARIDQLYKKGCCTIDSEKAQKIWDEYQEIILEQCPLIYLVSARTFCAINNRWSQDNFYYDNYNGSMSENLYLKSDF